MSTLALDLGTATGYALGVGTAAGSGTMHFPRRPKAHPGARWSAYREWLHNLITVQRVSLIAYEDVKSHKGALAAHCYGAFLGMTEMVAQQHNIPLLPLGVGQIKRAWTGRGDANKALMIQQAIKRGHQTDDHNEADALAILHLAIQLRAKEAA